MWDLDNQTRYVKVLELLLPWANTWADARPGHTDKKKREKTRAHSVALLRNVPEGADKWHFVFL